MGIFLKFSLMVSKARLIVEPPEKKRKLGRREGSGRGYNFGGAILQISSNYFGCVILRSLLSYDSFLLFLLSFYFSFFVKF